MKRAGESGNIMIYILIAVILFAALSYTVAQMMRGGADIGQEKSSMAASEILEYAHAVRQAVQNLKISNACEDEDISFENTVVAGYTNGVNTKCQIFHPDGGALNWVTPSESITAQPWFFQGVYAIQSVGTGNTDLIMSVSNIPESVCTIINERLDVPNPSGPPENDGFDTTVKFTGTYSPPGSTAGNNGEEGHFSGKMAACFDGPPAGTYHFYQVLIAR
jgi:hypothetical protein